MTHRVGRWLDSIRSTAVGVERTPSGRRLAVARRIDAPPAAIWTLLADTHRWPEWGPAITAVASTDREIVPGTRGRIRLVGGCSLPFEIETCANGCWTWSVGGYRATDHRVEPAPVESVATRDGREAEATRPDRCRAVVEFPLLAAPCAVVCARALDRLATLADEIRRLGSGPTATRTDRVE